MATLVAVAWPVNAVLVEYVADGHEIPAGVTIALKVAGGLIFPVALVLAAGFVFERRRSERLFQQLETSKEQLKEAEQRCSELIARCDALEAEKGLRHEALVKHLLNNCCELVGLIAMDFHRERGPGYVRARERLAENLAVFITMCRQNYMRDRELLRRLGSTDRGGYEALYIRKKKEALAKCDDAHRVLTVGLGKDESKRALKEAGQIMRECSALLEQTCLDLERTNDD